MRINEYIQVKNKNAKTDKKEETDISQIQGQKTALQSMKAKAKEKRSVSKDALRQIKKELADSRKNNNE